MKVMVVDDDPVIRMVVTGGLSALGHEIVQCETGDQAWDILKRATVPLLITDWSMPGMDGLQLTELVRRTPSDTYTYIVMLTGKVSREDYLASVKAGVDAFLTKPLDSAMLEAQLSIASRILGLEAHAKKLEAIMTVCSYCKRVKHQGHWTGMEQYVAQEFKTLPSHTYCPSCFKEKVEPQLHELGIPTEGLEGH